MHFFRHNWPLLAAGGMLFLSIVYLLAQLPFYSNGFEGTFVIYPLVVWTNKTGLIFLIISVLALLFLTIKGQRRPTAYWLFMGLMILGLGVAFGVGFLGKQALLAAIILLIAIVFNVFSYVGGQQLSSRVAFIQVAGVMFMVNAFTCYGWFLTGIRWLEHREMVQYKSHSYQLAIATSPLTEFPVEQAIVYECDLSGWFCRNVFASNGYYLDAESMPQNLKLVVDGVADSLLLQLGDEKILIAE